MFKPFLLSSDIINAMNYSTIADKFMLPIPRLSSVNATNKKSRQEYLVEKVCKRYHEGDEDVGRTGT